jgi:hypothetical protein
VRFFVVADHPDESLALTVFDPFSTAVVKAEHSGELSQDFCPRIAGPYAIDVAPEHAGAFTVSAAECPKHER